MKDLLNNREITAAIWLAIAVMQSFGGRDAYPLAEEKAAHLLYFLVKNHSFVDGNKRIAENALVAMTLMIAESKPKERDFITAMLTNLIAGK